MDSHPDLEAEQAYVARAYERLDRLRADTEEMLRSVLDQGLGGTHQFREERDVIVRTSLARLDQLDIGDQALCFGRIDRWSDPDDRDADGPGRDVESFHIGRLGVSGDDLEPLVVDWRAPVAEPFYRATGRDPMGLVLRRHLASQGRQVVGIEDERFGRVPTAVTGGDVGADDALVRSDAATELADGELELGGPGALLAALAGARTGFMRDIVATIQAEQDEIIRARLPGVLVVQGGPGTGKTAVALHRAAYLLYTFRFPLERQGVLVIGPNPLFLRYIEHVLPSLGESGVTLSTVSGLVRAVSVRAEEPSAVALLKGDARMAGLVGRAVRTRQRGLRREAIIPYGSVRLRLTPELSTEVVAAARRRPGTHNARRHFVEQLVLRRLADQYERALERWSASTRGSSLTTPDPTELERVADAFDREGNAGDGYGNGHREPGSTWPAGPDAETQAGGRTSDFDDGWSRGPDAAREGDGDDVNRVDIAEFSRQLRRVPELVEALDRMWPRMTAQELLHDLYGAPALLALAAKGILSPSEQSTLARQRSHALPEIPWTAADLALIDEARALLGPRTQRTTTPSPAAEGSGASPGSSSPVGEDDAPRTYGHIVVDEAQDLSPMQLRMVARRSLSGSVTVVGDIGQATGPWAPADWDEVTAHLPRHRPPIVTELTVSYRTPAEVVDVAREVLADAAPDLTPPRPVRRTGDVPRFVASAPARLAATVADMATELCGQVSPGTTAVLAPASLVADLAVALDAAGVAATDPRADGLGAPLSLLPVDLANGLEFDAVVVVEPAAVVEESPQGLRGLYVALTRPTRLLAVVHSRSLPASLRRVASRPDDATAGV